MNLPELTRDERAALAFLMRTATKYGLEKCWPKRRDIGRAIHKNERTASRIIGALVARGIIARVERGPQSSAYKILASSEQLRELIEPAFTIEGQPRPPRLRQMRAASHGESWQTKRRRLLAVLGAEQDWRCFYCERPGNDQVDANSKTWHLDHKHPELRGTPLEDADLVLACARCNVKKSDRSAEEFCLRIAKAAARIPWGLQ
jgi:hypothetical protein